MLSFCVRQSGLKSGTFLSFNSPPTATNLQSLRKRIIHKLGAGSIPIPLARRGAARVAGAACVRVPCALMPWRRCGAGQSRLSPQWGLAAAGCRAYRAGRNRFWPAAAGADHRPHRPSLCPLSKPGFSRPARSLPVEGAVVCEGPRKANKKNSINSTSNFRGHAPKSSQLQKACRL